MVLCDSNHCFGAFSGYSLAVRSTETPGNRDDLTDFALFYGPEPKRISKKVFVGGVVGLTAASLLGELVGNFIGKGI